MTKEMRRVAATVLAAASLLLMAVSASALTVLDTSKKAVPPNSFVTKVKVAQSQFKAGKWLAVPFSPATAITADKLRQLTLGELNTLEESMFPATTKWFDNNGVSRYGKLSTKALSSENAKAVERIRTERAKAEAMMPKVKNNASLDLNGDGKKEKISYGLKGDDVFIKVGAATYTEFGYEVEDVYTLDIDGKQKALFIDILTDNDYVGATVLIYNGKTLKSIADIGNRDSFRYSGKGMLYSEVKNVPVSAVECFKLSAKGVAHSSRRAQPALRQVSPYMKNAAEGWPDDDYSLKCAALGGGTVTFKAGEVLTVIYCEPVVWSDDEGPESEAYIALMNKQGKIGMFSTSEYGYNIGGTEISFNESFSGFTFMP